MIIYCVMLYVTFVFWKRVGSLGFEPRHKMYIELHVHCAYLDKLQETNFLSFLPLLLEQ